MIRASYRSAHLCVSLITAVTLLVGCASTPSTDTTNDEMSSTESVDAVVDSTLMSGDTTASTVVRIDVTVGIDDDPGRIEKVALGSDVQITLENPDEPDEFHLHGYDLDTGELEPGEPADISFTANTAGEFVVESHETGDVLMTLIVE